MDVVLRARTAYLEGEKYMSWYQNPKLKEADVADWYAKEKQKYDNNLSKGKIDKDEYDKRMEILEFTKGQKLRESSIKYAYVLVSDRCRALLSSRIKMGQARSQKNA